MTARPTYTPVDEAIGSRDDGRAVGDSDASVVALLKATNKHLNELTELLVRVVDLLENK